MSKHIDVILDNIQTEKCVLMIGPDLAVNQNGIPFQTDIMNYFEKETNLQLQYDIDNLIIFKNKSSKQFYYSDLKKYYEKNSIPSELHNKIARIPFNLIISISPDIILKRAFENLSINYNFQFYNKKENSKDIKRPTKDNPLLYNLFGSITEDDSLIITYDDLFEFIFSILGGEQRLPRELKNSLLTTKVFLFLGFDLEKWYMKLIIRLFDLHKQSMPIAYEKSVKDEKLRNFYIKNFEMEFIKEDTSALINEIYLKAEKSNILREIKQIPNSSITNKIKELIKDDKIENALETLEDYLENKDDSLFNMVIQISGTYSRLQKNIAKGTISRDEINIQLAKVRETVISIADDLNNLNA